MQKHWLKLRIIRPELLRVHLLPGHSEQRWKSGGVLEAWEKLTSLTRAFHRLVLQTAGESQLVISRCLPRRCSELLLIINLAPHCALVCCLSNRRGIFSSGKRPFLSWALENRFSVLFVLAQGVRFCSNLGKTPGGPLEIEFNRYIKVLPAPQ